MTDYQARKAIKKQHRCQSIIEREQHVQSSNRPTPYLAVLNAGLSCGLAEEQLLSEATQHGAVRRVLMVPSKSYCFLECCSVDDAASIFVGMHNRAVIGQRGAVVYLAYFEQLPMFGAQQNVKQDIWPSGLLVLEDFVTPAEEQLLLAAVGANASSDSCTVSTAANELKHRHVRHFGYEFLYTTNNVDVNKPLPQQIPDACEILWPRLRLAASDHDFVLDWSQPDQLTVNEYAPGQGIPPHVDTHSAFLAPILSLSLLGATTMDFRRGVERVTVQLPRRSLLVMDGEARYDWTHGITPRMLDVVVTTSGGLTTRERTPRVSLTFRRLRRTTCDCAYPTLCDTALQQRRATQVTLDAEQAKSLESSNVHAVYDCIATHFSETRHTPWPRVAAFLASFPPGAVVVDVGCGSGKYLECNRQTLTVGCDRSSGLLDVCLKATVHSRSVFQCDCLHVPLRSQCADGCISIAVIHHLATAERRLAAVWELARLLRPGGRGLVYVWARNQRQGGANNKKSSYLLQNKAVNRQRSTVEQQRQLTKQQWQDATATGGCGLPVHTNRTDFQQQDILVPWKLKSSGGDDTTLTSETPQQTFLRFYHVFEAGELEQLIEQVPKVQVLDTYYDQGNHCVVFERLE